jgi:aquaporin Z
LCRWGFASNGYAEHSPGGYSLLACLTAEVVLTFMFLMIILGATDKRAPQGFAPIAIGLGLTLIHLVGIPVTNLSVNPARSTGPALFVGAGRFRSSGCSGLLRLLALQSPAWLIRASR